jgi:hypothetical protein
MAVASRENREAGDRQACFGMKENWRSDMGVEPTQDGITAPQTVLKSASSLLTVVKPGPHGSTSSLVGPRRSRWLVGRLLAAEAGAEGA